MNDKAVALRLTMAALMSSSLLSSASAAVDPEKQPIYVNIMSTGLCGTDPSGQSPPSPCTVPGGQRLIIEHVSGYVFLPTSERTTVTVSILIKDTGLGLGGTGELGFHSFVATKTESGPVSDTFVFNTPFRMMLNPGATYYFSPADNAAVSGYLVKD